MSLPKYVINFDEYISLLQELIEEWKNDLGSNTMKYKTFKLKPGNGISIPNKYKVSFIKYFKMDSNNLKEFNPQVHIHDPNYRLCLRETVNTFAEGEYDINIRNLKAEENGKVQIYLNTNYPVDVYMIVGYEDETDVKYVLVKIILKDITNNKEFTSYTKVAKYGDVFVYKIDDAPDYPHYNKLTKEDQTITVGTNSSIVIEYEEILGCVDVVYKYIEKYSQEVLLEDIDYNIKINSIYKHKAPRELMGGKYIIDGIDEIYLEIREDKTYEIKFTYIMEV